MRVQQVMPVSYNDDSQHDCISAASLCVRSIKHRQLGGNADPLEYALKESQGTRNSLLEAAKH